LTKTEENQIKETLDNLQKTIENYRTVNKEFDIVGFSKGYVQGYGSFTPDLQNTAFKNLSLNPSVANAETVHKYIENAKESEFDLIAYCQNEYLRSALYKRNLDYIKNLPAFNLAINCKNAKTENDYNSDAYKKDLKVVKDFLRKFNYKEEFSRVFFQMLNTESYYCMLRTDLDNDKYVLQEFPYLYAKLTGRFSYGFLADYNMNYFMQPSIDINLYPKWMKKRYYQLFNGKDKKYIPSSSIDKRTGNFAYWVQTSPEDGCFVFKMNDAIATNVPYFTSMLADLVLVPIYRDLELNQDMLASKKVFSTIYPLLKEQKTGNTQDMLAVDPVTMGKIVGACAAALGNSFNILNIPSDDIKSHEFTNTNKGSYSDELKNVASLLNGGRSLFATDKQTAAETNLGLNIDEMVVENVYPQFANFLEYYINMRTKKYKFAFKFSGTNSYQNRKDRMDKAFQAADKGFVSANKIANSMDLDIFELEDELLMTKAMGFDKKLISLINVYTQSSKDAGRPQKDSSELTESGQETRDQGSNIEKGGEV
jgi:hypothetical protein